jgi:hypothetical protein
MGPSGGLTAGVIAGVDPNKKILEIAKEPSKPVATNVEPDYSGNSGPMGGLRAGVIAGVTGGAPVTVIVTIDGQELTSIITETQVNDSLSGTFSDINRVAARGSVGVR